MRRPRFLLTVLTTVAGILAGVPATAQSGPKFGPPVPGVCLLGRADALEKSARGREIAARITRAESLLAGKVAGDKARVQAELARLGSVNTARRLALLQEMNTIVQYDRDSQARIEALSTSGYAAIEPALVAALSKVVTQRRCSLIVERSITYGWNNAMDITDAVIVAIDAGS